MLFENGGHLYFELFLVSPCSEIKTHLGKQPLKTCHDLPMESFEPNP